MNKLLKRLYPLLLLGISFTGCGKKSFGTVPEVSIEKLKNVYVSTEGSDANKGEINSPVRTIQKGLALAKPGDTVFVRSGTYKEKINVLKSGTRDKYISIMPYPEERAVISGDGLGAYGNEGLVVLSNVSWIRLEGFEICNFKTYNAWANVDGIVVKSGANNIVIKNNKVFDIQNNSAPDQGRSAHGIHIIGNTEVPITEILVENNEIFDCNTGYSENLTVNGYVDGFEIINNKVYNGENIGIVVAGGYAANPNPLYNYARNGVISNNEVYAILGSSGPIPTYQGTFGAPGIYIDGARDIIVEKNRVHDNDRGIGVMSENKGFPTSNCVIRNNYVFNNYTSGIYLGGYEDQAGGGGTVNCVFVNNTLFYNNRENGYFGEIEGEFRLKQGCTGNTFKNNIVYTRPDKGVFVNKENTGGSDNTFDYNVYYSGGASKWIWDKIVYSDVDQWRAAVGGDSNSSSGLDPKLINLNLPDLGLHPASLAKNTGVFISEAINGTTDINNRPRIADGKIDRGAYELSH
ncbi:right-handed parallel beta-helix repeat-containing protein [Desertivirga xinjiangensis]|uniref:right-handed parallel beta-helix repeat-containing protein n=1 Tax=Desertivirga xinjiangensis TaxID=539206 RepID=UPI00210BABD3|nr:right-handed parallel beta-helix repeat-containing protein [Pedobacter xinjiangensis]